MTNWIYDIETYPTAFTISAINAEHGARFRGEISIRKDERDEIFEFLLSIRDAGGSMVGFNNIGFDYPVLHHFIDTVEYCDAASLYKKASDIINSDDQFGHTIWPEQRYIKQVDLYLIHHFNNAARRTSLKVLQINMRSDSVEDLPYEPGQMLNAAEIEKLAQYNDHDVDETLKFFRLTAPQIAFRKQLSEKYGIDFTNHNDTKIGKDYFIQMLERISPGITKQQTPRPSINLKDVVLDSVAFSHPEFNRILDYFKTQTITETKGVFNGLHCTVAGFDYHFGVGGIHGSLNWHIAEADDDRMIIDLDVASYYPNLAIANNLRPEHLGENFCDIYKDVYDQRRSFKKGTPENAMLKLALNGVYGDSNNKYSPFYDPKYTMAITINGQLLLCMLAEWLENIPGLQMIQINTDGLTVKIPRALEFLLNDIWQQWENITGLTLESGHYSRMFVRDVNNYVAEYTDGKLKRKGAYEYIDLEWNKNHSGLIIAKAAVEKLVNNTPIEQTINECTDPFDFMMRAKVPRSNTLLLGDQKVQGTSRYYVAINGAALVKQSPPVKGATVGQYKRKNGVSELDYRNVMAEVGEHKWDERIHTKNKSKYENRRTELEKGYLTALCNKAADFDFNNLNRQYYIDQARKLVDNFFT